MGLSEEIKAEIESQLETFKKELKKELQSLFNQRTTDTINGVEEKYLIMSSGMTGALSAATIKFDNATKLISGVTVIDKLDQYGITVDNIHQILDTNRKAFSGFTQSATTLFKKLQEDVESGITFAVSSVSGIIRTNIESGLTSAITEANAQLFDQSKEFTNGVFANASAFTLSKFNEVSSNLGSLSGEVRGLASGFTGLNNQFVFYTPTSAMSGVVLNITNDKFVKQNDFGEYSAATESALTNINGQINGVNSNFTDIISKFDDVDSKFKSIDNNFTDIINKFDDVDRQIDYHGTNIEILDTQLKSFSATVESITKSASTVYATSGSGTYYLLGHNSSSNGNYSVYKNNNVYMNNGSIFAASDRTLKTHIEDIDGSLDKIKKIPKVYFHWNNDEDKKRQMGTYAQDLEEVYPELVTKDKDGIRAVAYDRLGVVALAGIDKLYDMVQELMKKNDIDYYIREAVQEVIGNNYVSKNEFISFSGTVSNKIYGVADGSDIVYP